MGVMMTSNFRIFLHQNRNNLHLKLSGEFDGSSAHQLINTLKNHYGNARNIYIHTSSLSSAHPFGLVVFKKNCAIDNLIFTGEYANALAPAGSNII